MGLIVVPKQLLTKKIDQFLHEAEKRNQEDRFVKLQTRGYRIYPSSIDKCARSLVYEYRGLPKKLMEPRICRICQNGSDYHDRIQKKYLDQIQDLIVEHEMPIVSEELRLSGRLDTLIKLDGLVPSKAGQFAIIEFKSVNNRDFEKAKKEQFPMEKHILQLQLYLELKEVEVGILFYENKNNQEVLEFWMNRDRDRGKKIMDKIKKINQCMDENTLPEREGYNKESYTCRWCDYQEICWNK